MNLVEQLSDSYVNWLKQKITFKELENAVEITTPFMDRHNDYLQIYVQQKGTKLTLSDAGYILTDLKLSGCDVFSSPKRKKILQTILNGYGVKVSSKEELFVETTLEAFPQKKHMLVQAMMTVNDMFMTSRENVQSIFLEEVDQYLFDNDVRFVENISFTGKSGFPQTFHFAIPRSRQFPERILHALNNPTKQNSENLLFAWTETKQNRRPNSILFAVLNDSEKSIRPSIINAFHEYEIQTILWSKRNEHTAELTG
ncbi:DUF1828 domain-containing protein [Paenibacillus athensensis]|uniref:DUF1829 domain-containing protein n=1 Tax=Paenibacillus athensensis TaxID=1967502 RepID=A0A4Y8PR01_9BACL|nr:DUF1829 domain-containing protein [Paenibacillus athensensis]MCD1262031.1 DUF1828 domain-containing protein [Paenibacillus athensensis]